MPPFWAAGLPPWGVVGGHLRGALDRCSPDLGLGDPLSHPPPAPVHASGGRDLTREVGGGRDWQADICHAYQIMSNNGIADENIIVMMYDDLAQSRMNPTPGKIINKPGGPDVYHGVPKDYTGRDVNAKTFLAVLGGDSEGVAHTTGSKKVLSPAPEDNVFVYFADHGGPGILGMPSGGMLHAKDLTDVLLKMSAKKSFNELVFYVEACYSGTIFDGMIPKDSNIYVVTAANTNESSWGYYCPGMTPAPPKGYNTCLGDLFSISFLENCDANDLSHETLLAQYQEVKERTSQKGTYQQGSHVMQYGDTPIDTETCNHFMGPKASGSFIQPVNDVYENAAVQQYEADIISLRAVHEAAPEGPLKEEARAELESELAHRERVDSAIERVVSATLEYTNLLPSLIGQEAKAIFSEARPEGQPLVDDWACHKELIQNFEGACSPLGQYGMKHGRAFANVCNRGLATAFNQALAMAC